MHLRKIAPMNKHPNLYIFRHGLTYEVKYKKRYILDNKDVPILPESLESIKRIGEYLQKFPLDFFVSSSYLRCTETAQAISKIIEKPFVLDERLIDYQTAGDLPPGTKRLEYFDSFEKRIMNFFQEMQSKQYKNVAICTHGIVVAALKNLVLDKNIEEYTLNYPPPGVLTIIKEGKIEEIDFNTL